MNALWSLLRCPACMDALRFEPLDGEREGLLRSACGIWFPVVDGIPRIFVGEMRSIYARDFAPFLARHRLELDAPSSTGSSRQTRQKLATRESFGYEWTHFHQMLPEWLEAARFYFEPIGGVDSLRGQSVLDAGCGKARQAYYAMRAGARVVCVDFSRAIDVAARNCDDVAADKLFVQSDLLAMPFAPDTFDVTYSLGVLHHLPSPEEGFSRIAELARPGGRVLIYVYHALEQQPVKRAILGAVTLARRVTTRMPHRLLLPVTTAFGYALYAGVVLPYKVMSRFDLTRPAAESLPLKFYADYPVHVIVNDQFDRFSAPIENRYTRDEVAAWLDREGLINAVILGGSGWRAAATKPSRRDPAP
jgi:SAM-dependent methyltransferase